MIETRIAIGTTYIVEVTQSDINNGVQGSPEQCAIALAFTRRLGMPVNAYKDEIYIPDWDIDIDTPVGMIEFIENFDDNKHLVKPSTFMVTIP